MLRGWWRRRRKRLVREERVRRALWGEYQDRLDAQDPSALEASRDFGDNDNTPWRTEVGMGLAGLAVIVLFACVAVLIVLFSGIQDLTGG